MKICLITNIYEPYQLGGTEVYVKWLTNALRQKGHEISVITTCPAEKAFSGVVSEVVDGITVHRFYPWNIYWGYRAQEKPLILKPLWHLVELWNPQVYLRMRTILRRELPDVVHIHNMGGFSNAIFRACKTAGHKVIYTLHDYITLCPKSILLHSTLDICKQARLACRVYRGIKRLALRNCVDLFISPSAFARQLHQRHGLFGERKSYVVPFGVAMNGSVLRMRKALNKTKSEDDCITLLYLGQVVEHKGLSVLAQAFRKINRDDLRLWVAGDGDYLESLQSELQGCRNVTYYGYVSGEDKENLFLESDAFVLPSLCYDNAPLTILEATSYGLPVIGSRIGGIPELVQESETGFLFEPGDEFALASILNDISKERLQSMTLACQESAERYSMERHLDKLLDIYTEVTGVGAKDTRGQHTVLQSREWTQ